MSPELSPDYIGRPGLKLAALLGSVSILVSACGGQDDHDAPVRNECETFRVYAQNRWSPLGSAVKVQPDILSKKLDPGFAGNEVIAVDGWKRTGVPAYPTNPEPWNSDIWFHLATRDGWVNYAAVRGAPTSPDLTGFDPDGGEPATTPVECEIRD